MLKNQKKKKFKYLKASSEILVEDRAKAEECIMKETASHSNTPAFTKNESNTKPVLYQHPTPAEMRRSRIAQFKADFKDFILFAVFAFCAWLLISVLLTVIFGG